MRRTLRVDLTGRLSCLGRLLAIFGEFAAIHDIPLPARRDAHLVLDEVVSNVIYHGSSPKRPCQIRVETTLRRGVLRISVSDDCRPFNPLRVAQPDTTLPVSERSIGGLGIALVKNAMDDVRYRRRDGRNRLTMTRIVNRRRASDRRSDARLSR